MATPSFEESRYFNTSHQYKGSVIISWLSGYSKRNELVLTGGASGAQTDFQLELAVAYAAAMQGDFDDLRFTQANGTTLIDAWLESKVDDTSAVVFAEFPTTPANTVEQDYYMYYGNGSAVSDWDGHATFRGFDDAETGDKTYWTEDNGGIEIVTDPKYGTYGIKGNQGAGSLFLNAGYIGNSESDFIYEGWVKPTGNNWGGISIRRSGTTTFYLFWFNNGSAISPIGITLTKMISGARTDLVSGALTYSLGTWYKFKITANGTSLKLDIDGNNIIDTTDSSIASGYAGIGGYQGTNREVVVDDIFIRKYASGPPTYAFGSEESAPGNPYWYYNMLKRRN